MIHLGRPDFEHQQSLGFSCVLFAWMVVFSLLQDKFCPIFLIPTLCFPTVSPPLLPALRFNLGPFVLLFATKLIIPQSSLIGHLAGIVLGYPLAWGWCTWIKPPLFCAICATAIVFTAQLQIWTLSDFRSAADLSPLVRPRPMMYFRALWVLFILYTAALAPAFIIVGVTDGTSRLLLAMLLYLSIEARRCEWLSDVAAVQDKCISVMQLTVALSAILAVSDVMTLGGLLGCWELLEVCLRLGSGAVLDVQGALVYLLVLAGLEAAAVCLILLSLQSASRAREFLHLLRIDVGDCVTERFTAFSGSSHVLAVAVPLEQEEHGGDGTRRALREPHRVLVV